MQLKLSPAQIQKTVLSPFMQQAMAVLMVPIMDLTQAIEDVLLENPLLERTEETNGRTPNQDGKEKICLNWERYHRSYERLDENIAPDDFPEERPLTRPVTLEEHLLQQLHWEVSDPVKLCLGEFIIGNIDEDGYLKMTSQEIADALRIGDLNCVEETLKTIQNFEPTGIASRNLEECLCIQAVSKYNGKSDLLSELIRLHLDDLGAKQYAKVARKLKTTPQEIQELARMIADLEPKPARNYRDLPPNIYIKPDCIIKKDPEAGFQVYLNQDGIPPLKINALYKNMLKSPHLKEEERLFIRDKLKVAIQFIKNLEQRGKTLCLIAQCIVDRQKDFLGGTQSSIAPMALKEVAILINRSESTVSRAIHGKYIDTPQGLFPMKFFFSHAVLENQDGPISSQSIKERMRELIETEDKCSPLSDQDIQNYFTSQNLRLARRTIAKYRKALKIPPGYQRRTYR